MVRKTQEQEDYENYDPVPYKGGYDLAARYGSVKPADKECGYQRSQLAAEEPVAQYGNERNPYSRGPPGPSIFGGVPKPGAVYGSGRDRTEPSTDEAQSGKGVVKTGSGRQKPANGKQEQSHTKPDHSQEDVEYGGGRDRMGPSTNEAQSGKDVVKTGSGRRTPANGKQQEQSDTKPDHSQEDVESGHTERKAANDYEVSEESGYRKLKSIYDAEEQRNPACGVEVAEYRHSYYDYDETNSGNSHKPQPAYSEVDQYGYRKLFYGYGEAGSGYRDLLYGYGDGESGSSNPQITSSDEDSVYRKPFKQEESRPGPIYGEQATSYYRSASDEGAYGSYDYGDGESRSSNPQITSNDEDSVYRKPFKQEVSRPGPIYGEQATSYDRSASDEGAYGSYGHGYGYQPNYSEESSGYGGHWKQFDDDDPARFGGGSAFVEEPIRNAPAPANRSWWW